MTRKEILHLIVTESGLPRNRAKQAVDIIFDALRDSIVKNDRIEIRGFGVFETYMRRPKVGWNMNTNEKINIPAQRAVKFKPGKDLRDI